MQHAPQMLVILVISPLQKDSYITITEKGFGRNGAPYAPTIIGLSLSTLVRTAEKRAPYATLLHRFIRTTSTYEYDGVDYAMRYA